MTRMQPKSRSGVGLSRRDWLKLSAAGVTAATVSGWFETLAARAAGDRGRLRSCILLWMSGGPSQLDTFDPKPKHANAGPVKAIDTDVPGIQISEYLPKLARQMRHSVIVRSMSTKEGDHTRGTHLMRTGYLPQGPVRYPTLGSLLSKELGVADTDLPDFVSVAPYKFLSPAAYGAGFLGPQYAPLEVGGNGAAAASPDGDAYERALRVQNLDYPSSVTAPQFDARLDLLSGLERDFLAEHPGASPRSHRAAYHAAVRMMRSEARRAFELDQEPDHLRDAYGRNQFGQGCLLARRLVERGVPFVEVSLNGVDGAAGIGWDTHQNNFESVKKLCETLDPGWATLLSDLDARGLLDSTLVVWMGEFGRTPRINGNQGRDHFPGAWSTVLCGGGVAGGQVFGRTSDDGQTVLEHPVSTPDLLATVCHALGVDPMKQNMSNVGRPIRIVNPDARAISEVLA